MGKPPCYDKSDVRRGPWTAEEDAKLLVYTATHGTKNWTSVPKKAGLNRCGKSCRLRWTNYLRPNLKHESFTQQEEELIITLHATIGSRWSIIAQQLPGRTDNDVKNIWNTKLSKKLVQRGIDPVTHRPISDIIQSIGGLPASTGGSSTSIASRYRTSHDARISCLNQDLKTVFLSRPSGAGQAIIPPLASYESNHLTWLPPFPLQPLHASPYYSRMEQVLHAHLSAPLAADEASSSSTVTTARQNQVPAMRPASPDLEWREFLVEDSFLSHEKVNDASTPSYGDGDATITVDQNELISVDYDEVGRILERDPSGSSSGSFVDEMLERDKEMVTEFPRFLDDPCDFL